ncbi:hypothetical protein SO802_007684 [Lithocarpus litseifolius]|uniref:Bulb-type lectin domain-containing protein n=1 Tax=Lithocarpus litseifolius TaxID=425828 RepID=A0AAW2DV07_9ROSI
MKHVGDPTYYHFLILPNEEAGSRVVVCRQYGVSYAYLFDWTLAIKEDQPIYLFNENLHLKLVKYVKMHNFQINDSKKLWESFNDPTDSFLPGMRVQVNAEMGENRAFTSWKSASDPSPGNYTMGVDPQASPQIVIWEGEHRRWRSGYWDGRTFSGVPNITASSYMYGFKLSDLENQSRWQEKIIHPCDNNNCCSWSSPPRCIHIHIMEVQNKTESFGHSVLNFRWQ